MINESLERDIHGFVSVEEISNAELKLEHQEEIDIEKRFTDGGLDKVKNLYRMRFWKLAHPKTEKFVSRLR